MRAEPIQSKSRVIKVHRILGVGAQDLANTPGNASAYILSQANHLYASTDKPSKTVGNQLDILG